jgi:hypothetical protein
VSCTHLNDALHCAACGIEHRIAELETQNARLRKALEARNILEAHLACDKGLYGLSKWLDRRDELESWERGLRKAALAADEQPKGPPKVPPRVTQEDFERLKDVSERLDEIARRTDARRTELGLDDEDPDHG